MEINANTEVKAGLESNHIIDLSDRLYKIILAIIGLVALYVVGKMVYDFRSLPQNFPREISVTGEGKAYAKPDIATISFGVTAQAPKSQDAVNQGNEKMNAVIKAVKDSGVEDKDIRTIYYNVGPVYGQETRPLPMGAGGMAPSASALYYPYPGGTKITGYTFQQQVEVKIRNFDKINGIIDSATSHGANDVGSLNFTVDDIEKARSQAREKAIAQAKEKAEMLVNQAGLQIEKLLNVYDNYGGCGGGMCPPYGYGMGGVTMDAKEASVAPQIEPGQQEITASVTLTYQIR